MTLKSKRNVSKLEKMVEELNDIIEQTYYFEQKVFEWTKKVEKNKKQISKAMGKRRRVNAVVDENLSFTALKKTETKIDFYENQLKANLDKKIYKQAIDKTVYINDINGLIKLLKSYGVNPKEFKKFISTEEKANTDKIDYLVEMGELELDELQGCYKVEFDEEIKVLKNNK